MKINKKKGQSGLEYIILFSFTIVFFAIVVYIANEQLSIVNKQQRLEQAKLALKEIADAATQAYQQGAGAKVIKTVVFPNGISGDGEIVNNTLHIVFEGTDLSYPLNFPITGKISATPGPQEIIFTSYGGSVSVGTAQFSLSKYFVSLQLCGSSSPQYLNDTIQIINNNQEAIQVDAQVNFNSYYVNVTLSSYSFNIPVTESREANITFEISANTIGMFTGNILFNSSNYSVIVPIILDIQSCGGPTSNVSYILLETYKDPGYSIHYTNFSMPPLVNITTTGWTPYSYITLDLRNSSGSMPGYPKLVQTDSDGNYSEIWNATGMPGSYTVYANYSIYNVNYSFVVNPC
ncbi:MAG: hypothetical protein QXO35_03515 [Candidatus Micrarchaeia archaeon]